MTTRNSVQSAEGDWAKPQARCSFERGTVMGIVKKIRHKAETAEGAIKNSVGKSAGNERMESEGSAERTKGNAKQASDKIRQAGEKVRHIFRH